MSNSIPHHLRAARKQAGMSLEEASARLSKSKIELSPGQLSRLERGESGVSQERLIQLGSLYGWTPSELLGGRDAATGHGVPRARMLPLISNELAANWTEGTSAEPIRWIAAPNQVGHRAFVVEVSGPSMEPEFHDRDLIVVDPDLSPNPGNFVVARIDTENEATFKRYRFKGVDSRQRPLIELVPLNPDWPIMTLDERRGGRIVGVATDHIRRLIQ